MTKISVLKLCSVFVLLAGCVDVNARTDKVRDELSDKKLVSDFLKHLDSNDFDCNQRTLRSERDWYQDFPEQAKERRPDTVLVCFWNEDASFFTITRGTIRVIAYASQGEILAYKTEDFYTGP